MAALPSLFESCVPRDEVLSGELTDALFAANLGEVVAGTAHPIYRDPEQFFANTYLTERVQSFFREVVGRLSGADPTAGAGFRVHTAFGGGKTHTLIGLYHIVRSDLSAPTRARLGISDLPTPPKDTKVAAVVGGMLDPSNGTPRGGVQVHHLWGELAFQLGGADGYRLVQASDERGLSPGPQFLDALIGDAPALILIDEPAEYARKSGAAPEQLPAFLKMLADWSSGSGRRTALVITLAWDPETGRAIGDAFGPETERLATALREVNSVVERPIREVTPAEPADIAPILRQRLFTSVDPSAAGAVAIAYAAALQSARDRGASLPMQAVQADYRGKLEAAYPFHPAFVALFDGKLRTIPNFQQTRGALRLLARVIRQLWQTRPADTPLVHPFAVDFRDPAIIDELTNRLDRAGLRQAVTYDIGRDSHAARLDAELFAGHPPYATRVGATVFLHSLNEPPARGVELRDINEACLTPDTDVAHLSRALEALMNEAWHLDREGERYAFRVEPSPNRIVRDEMEQVRAEDARREVQRRIEGTWRNGGLEVKHFPAEPRDLPNDPTGRLAVMHWDTATFRSGSAKPPEKLRELWEIAGERGEFRQFRNAVFFLVADEDRHERMLQLARRFIALDKLCRDLAKLEAYRLGKEQRARLDVWRNDADLQTRVAVTRAYIHLFYPVGDGASPYAPFAHYQLEVEDQGATPQNQTATVLRRLSELQKVRTADDPIVSAALIKQTAFDHGEQSVPLRALYLRSAERPRLSFILAPTYLKEVVKAGMKAKEWLYHDLDAQIAYENDEPLTDILIDDRHEVITSAAVKERGIKVFGAEAGHKEPERRRRGSPGEPVPIPLPVSSIVADGDAGKALADLRAQASDAGWVGIRTISVVWEADGKDTAPRLTGIRTVLGQVGAAGAILDVALTCQTNDGAAWTMTFKGPAPRYQALAPGIESAASQASTSHAVVTLDLAFSRPLAPSSDDFGELSKSLTMAGLGLIKVTARPPEGAGATA